MPPYPYTDTNLVDHLFFQPTCDYNNFPLKDPFTYQFGVGPFNASLNCYNKQHLGDLLFEYVGQFWEIYQGKRKYFSLRFIDPHEMTAESSRYLDKVLAKWLYEFDKRGYFENTLVELYSDHGMHINAFYTESEGGRNEKGNPFLFMMLPPSLASNPKISENMKKNTQRLMTHYDLFETEMQYVKNSTQREKLAKNFGKSEKIGFFGNLDDNNNKKNRNFNEENSKFSKFGKSFLDEEIYEGRDCKVAGVTDDCRCLMEGEKEWQKG